MREQYREIAEIDGAIVVDVSRTRRWNRITKECDPGLKLPGGVSSVADDGSTIGGHVDSVAQHPPGHVEAQSGERAPQVAHAVGLVPDKRDRLSRRVAASDSYRSVVGNAERTVIGRSARKLAQINHAAGRGPAEGTVAATADDR